MSNQSSPFSEAIRSKGHLFLLQPRERLRDLAVEPPRENGFFRAKPTSIDCPAPRSTSQLNGVDTGNYHHL